MIISNAHSSKPISTQILIHLMLINLIIENPVSGRFVDHCYSDIGCFPLSPEFYHPRHRPFNVRPWHRNRIKTRFDLYNRQHVDGYELRPWNKINLLYSGFNPLLETKIIIPGWLDNIKRATWVRRMKDSFLWLWQPVNIIVVHWRNFTPYTIATANTRVVGAELANLLKSIEHELHYDRAYYHLVGHSLGAHIGGYCGDRMPGLGRITALDPARPFFQHMPKSVRLNRADARFVDAIHSDFTPENAIFLLMSFGMTTPVGHLDFYPNGPPLLQPGCLRDTIMSVRNGIQRGLEHSSLSVAFLEAIRYLTACDHQRSHEWFTESITNRQCVFIGVRCNQFEGLINGRCTCDDSPSACAIMGIHADQMYLNNMHEDLWPAGHRSRKRRPSHVPVSALADSHTTPTMIKTAPLATTDGSLKSHVYSKLKQQAEQLRRPQIPTAAGLATDYELLAEDFGNIQDSTFVEYLRANLLPQSEFQHQASNELELRQDGQDDDLGLGHLLNNDLGEQQLNGHPKLLSDIDRDIESWYEESSRWYLKTNNRPNYCVNQYQVLVFIGPLRTTTGHHHIRANLIISIIGSRGQLLNQRFIPRSANLDSFTMQPFFIILEGTYSLGNIVSVAIGWEARIDPDPIQATVSFQSNLLESVQSVLPTYKAKHPWLSETMKYDHSDGFRWRKRNIYGLSRLGAKRAIKLPSHRRISRRSIQPEGCPAGQSKGDQCEAPSGLAATNKVHSEVGAAENSIQGVGVSSLVKLLEANTKIPKSIGKYQDLADEADEEDEDDDEEEEEDEMITRIESGGWPKQTTGAEDPLHASGSEFEASYIPYASGNQLDGDEKAKSSHDIPLIPKHLLNHEHQLLKQIHEDSQREITAKLHNIGIHQDLQHEDSIVVSQVVISPLQATYGKQASLKVAKIFCPPNQNFRLQKERTVRLLPNILGKCNSHQHYPDQPLKVQ